MVSKTVKLCGTEVEQRRCLLANILSACSVSPEHTLPPRNELLLYHLPSHSVFSRPLGCLSLSPTWTVKPTCYLAPIAWNC